MKCKDNIFGKFLPQYLKGKMPWTLKKQFEQHLVECEACWQKLFAHDLKEEEGLLDSLVAIYGKEQFLKVRLIFLKNRLLTVQMTEGLLKELAVLKHIGKLRI